MTAREEIQVAQSVDRAWSVGFQAGQEEKRRLAATCFIAGVLVGMVMAWGMMIWGCM